MSEETIRDIAAAAQPVLPPEPGADRAFELELARLKRNDTGNAERFIRRRGHDFLWVKDAGWFAWDGTRWDLGSGEVRVRLAAQEVAAAMAHEAAAIEAAGALAGEKESAFAERVDKAHKWAVGAGNAARLAAMVDEASPHLARLQQALDADPAHFNVANGTLVLGPRQEDGTVEILHRPHDRADLITRISPVAYDPDATTCPLWRSFLDFFLPDRAVQAFVQRYFGYCITGSIAEQCLVLLHGEGRNGKSTLVDMIAWVMGDYAVSIPINSLLANDRKGGSEATPDLARLPGARLVRSSEPKTGSMFDESLLKHLTGGEPITVRHLNKGFFEFTPLFKLVLSFNRRPTVRGDDDGIWRRFHLVPFEVQIDADKVDKQFQEKLHAEGPAILNWVLDGYRLWRETGLAVPDIVKSATKEYRDESDKLGNFLDAVCEIGAAAQELVSAAELYTAYAGWCKHNAVEPLSQNAFGRRLGERKGVTKLRSGTIRYRGIRIVDRTWLGEHKPMPGVPS